MTLIGHEVSELVGEGRLPRCVKPVDRDPGRVVGLRKEDLLGQSFEQYFAFQAYRILCGESLASSSKRSIAFLSPIRGHAGTFCLGHR